jgi:hypothetical protein
MLVAGVLAILIVSILFVAQNGGIYLAFRDDDRGLMLRDEQRRAGGSAPPPH